MKTTDITLESLQILQNEIKELHEKLGSWAEVGRHYGVHRVIVWRIVHEGYMPQRNELRCALGLSEIIEIKQYRDAQGRFTRKLND